MVTLRRVVGFPLLGCLVESIRNLFGGNLRKGVATITTICLIALFIERVSIQFTIQSIRKHLFLKGYGKLFNEILKENFRFASPQIVDVWVRYPGFRCVLIPVFFHMSCIEFCTTLNIFLITYLVF